MAAQEIHGHCLCGAVQYTLGEPPRWCCHCHCSECRRQVGGVVATFIGVGKQQLSLTRGAFAHYQSSPGVTRSFCADCGTPMAYETDRVPDEIHLYAGTLANPEDYPAKLEVYCRERLPWLHITVDGPAFPALPE